VTSLQLNDRFDSVPDDGECDAALVAVVVFDGLSAAVAAETVDVDAAVRADDRCYVEEAHG